MRALQYVKQKPRHKVSACIALILGMAMASNAMAAGHAGHGTGHLRGQGAPILDSAPPMSPTFNPASPYILPQAPEVPVSPASPGSVFGNG
jgi:hypothetical protein